MTESLRCLARICVALTIWEQIRLRKMNMWDHVGGRLLSYSSLQPLCVQQGWKIVGKSLRLEYSRVPSSNLAVASEATSGEKWGSVPSWMSHGANWAGNVPLHLEADLDIHLFQTYIYHINISMHILVHLYIIYYKYIYIYHLYYTLLWVATSSSSCLWHARSCADILRQVGWTRLYCSFFQMSSPSEPRLFLRLRACVQWGARQNWRCDRGSCAMYL